MRIQNDSILILQSPFFLKWLSFRDSYGRFPVMVMMDLVWPSNSLIQNLIVNFSRLVRVSHCCCLTLTCLEVISLRTCPRVLLSVPSFTLNLSSSLPLAPSNSSLAGNGLHANRVMACLGWNVRFYCRDQLLCLLWTLPESPLPNLSQSPFKVKKSGIMTLSLRSRCYRCFFNFLPHLPITVLSHVIILWLNNWQSFVCLEMHGIMTMFSRAGYRLFFNLSNPSASSVEQLFKSSDALFARATYDHLMVEDFAKSASMVESAMTSTDSSTFVNFVKSTHIFGNLMKPLSSFLCFILTSLCMNLPLLRI